MDKYTTEYNSKKYTPGTIRDSKHCGKFEILGKSLEGRDHYVVKFMTTGTVVRASGNAVLSGGIKDRMCPSVAGKGFLGIGVYNKSNSLKAYNTWKDMLHRVGNWDGKHPSYSKVLVCPRWLNFQNFAHDIQNLNGYSEWLCSNKRMSLDKDIGGKNLYSKETCSFIYGADNTRESSQRNKSYTFIATRIEDGYEEEALNQREFAKKYGLNPSCISGVLKGRNKTHKGWRFRRK